MALLACVGLFLVLRGALRPSPAGDGQEPPAASAELGGEGQDEVEISIAMIGDILQHHGVYESGEHGDGTRSFDHVFAHVRGYLADDDLRVVNQETPIAGEAFGFSGYPLFNGPTEMGDAEVAAGLNVVLRASNHTLDKDYDGLAAELAFWRDEHADDVAVIGAADPDAAEAGTEDPFEPYLFEKDGFSVALLNFTYDTNGIADPKGAVALLEGEAVRSAIEDADERADAVIAFPHWGVEYQLFASDEQRAMAKLMIEAGADAIIGGHPHVIEPYETLTAADGRKVPCFWSVGNFVSTQIDNENLVGLLARVVLRKDADGTVSAVRAEGWPTITHKGYGSDMTTYLLRDWTDALAATNAIAGHSENTSLTVDWADAFCAEVLGDGYDETTHALVVDLAQGGPNEAQAAGEG